MKDDRSLKTELLISKLLMWGVYLSAAVMLFGLILFVITGNSGYANDAYSSNPLAVIKGCLALKPFALMLTGLMLLILTPVFRVGISIFIFIKQKDYLYIIITTLVFLILIVSFLLGKTE